MIQANELRIGNYVDFKGLWIGQINGIHKGGPGIMDNNGIFSWEGFRPIPITEEWLLKFGFIETSTQEHRFELNPFVVYLWLTGVIVEIGKEFYETDNKYVHQLQNIVFALTGKELEIKTQ